MIVHLVTDRRRLAPGATLAASLDCLFRQAEAAVAAGVDAIQVREKDLDGRDLMMVVRETVARARGTSTRILVNDRMDVALAAGADGVHLGGRSLPVAAVRASVPPGFVVGRSVHDVDDADDAVLADYVIAGTLWPSASKGAGHAVLGLDGLRAIVKRCRRPVLAIGGVTVDRMEDVAASGAAGIAAIGAFMSDHATDCRVAPLLTALHDMRRRFDSAGSR